MSRCLQRDPYVTIPNFPDVHLFYRRATTHPALAGGVKSGAALYDWKRDPGLREEMALPSPSSGGRWGRVHRASRGGGPGAVAGGDDAPRLEGWFPRGCPYPGEPKAAPSAQGRPSPGSTVELTDFAIVLGELPGPM